MLTPGQLAEEQRLKARVEFACSEYCEALKAHGSLSRTTLEVLCFSYAGKKANCKGSIST
jgi:hypothetical protein